MICYWLNHALCLRPDDDKENEALAVLHDFLRAEPLKPRPGENSVGYEQPSDDDLETKDHP